MKLYALGCVGWIPGKNETSCFLVEEKNELIMLDAGTGASNLKDYQDVWGKYDSVSIILSHFHLDHLIGLIYLPHFLRGKKLRIYGPGKPAYEKTTEEYLNKMFQTAFFPTPINKLADQVEIYDYSASDFQIGDVKIQIREQKHTSPSYQICIDEKLVYATDVCFEKNEWNHELKGKVLLHECCEIDVYDPTHTTLTHLMEGISQEQFEQIYLIHHNAEWSDNDRKRVEEMVEGTKFSVLQDGNIIDIKDDYNGN